MISYRSYLLVLLAVILAFNFVDRLALGLFLQDIKTDLQLSDTQLGFLTGIAFALFYSVMGIPIARWTDRGNRVTIITLTTAVWSVAVALCAAATGFVQLMLIRVGVAIGEAGCIPPAHSLIADHFDRMERPRAIARYMLGSSLALTIGYFVAGWLNELYGWRMTFVILSLPGLGLAMLVAWTVKEPRATAAQPVAASANASSFREVCATLWTNVTFRHLLFAFSIFFLFGYGIVQWTPAFFIRSYGLNTGELGMWLALAYGVAGGLGMYLGGEIAVRYAANDERLQLVVCAFAFVFLAVLKACVYLAPTYHLAFTILALSALGGNIAQGPVYAMIQTLVPAHMRAVAIAFVYLFANLIGMGLGPLLVGTLSDALRPLLGEESLRYALLVLCPGYVWAGWHLWRASRTIIRDLQAAQVEYLRDQDGHRSLRVVVDKQLSPE